MPFETVSMRGDVVNRARIELGLNRAEFYRKVGFDGRTGAKVLAGGRVQIGTARRVAVALDKSVTDVADVSELVAATG